MRVSTLLQIEEVNICACFSCCLSCSPCLFSFSLPVPLSLLRHGRAHIRTCLHVPNITLVLRRIVLGWSAPSRPDRKLLVLAKGQSASSDAPPGASRATSLIGAIINLLSWATSKSHTRSSGTKIDFGNSALRALRVRRVSLDSLLRNIINYLTSVIHNIPLSTEPLAVVRFSGIILDQKR